VAIRENERSAQLQSGSFSGVRRDRETRTSVKVAEVVSRVFITAGGIGTIIAVSMIFVFLLSVVVPLFAPAEVESRSQETVDFSGSIAAGIDQYEVAQWIAGDDGVIRFQRLEDAAPVGSVSMVRETIGAPTSVAFSPQGDRCVLGFEDGGVQLVDVGFDQDYLPDGEEPLELTGLASGETAVHEGAVVQRTPIGRLRATTFRFEPDDLEFPLGEREIHLADATIVAKRRAYGALSVDGVLALTNVRIRTSMLGGVTRRVSAIDLPYAPPDGAGLPSYLFVNGRGRDVLLLWDDGTYQRYRKGPDGEGALVETLDLLPEEGARVTAAVQLIGRETLAVADDRGVVRTWFMVRDAADPSRLVTVSSGSTRPLEGRHVVALCGSPSSRLLLGGTNDGHLEIYSATSHELVGEAEIGLDEPIETLALSITQKTALAISGERLVRVEVDPKHPEASIAALFTPVWYEDYTGPEHVWQSTGGSDDFEPKLGMSTLVYGTLKATFYSMIFGGPLALLAAIFTSEFLSGRLRQKVKTVMELMASLPSVVLGFLGGLVIAPFVQDRLAGILGVLFALPFSFLLGAYLWQLLPRRIALPWNNGWQRFATIVVAIPIAVLLGSVFGPLIESIFFAGDAEAWLSGTTAGGATGGWAFLLLPATIVLVAFIGSRVIDPLIRDRLGSASHGQLARAHLVKFLVGSVAAVLIAFVVGFVLSSAGADPRGGLVDTYVQRNALVVGFVMGFAIIPIIYTLAEDALSSVPEHLRQASLGAGATPWQTATRVIVPTAMSGLFSAVMIGLGRAVGETMIVLMATGNTPIMDLNIFNGFRTLSANIAVELPESAKDSTHYRVLFLAALTLFAMTFVLNTFAEFIRQRFRKRAYQL